jgi:glycosyltransferase involved in cell wall biosynthesis
MDTDSQRSVPLVSVITPSMNQASFLEATLQSVAEQDYPQIEHLVFDGGSSDGSLDILRRWGEKTRVHWTSQPDRGQADAIQRGFDTARGDIVTWLNSDDVYLDSHVISDVVAAFSEGADVVTGGGCYLSAVGERLQPIPIRPRALNFATLRHVDWVLQPSTFMRRPVVDKFRLDTSLHYAFDWDFFIRIAQAYDFTVVARELAGYRLHPAGKTIGRGDRRRHEIRAVAARYNPPYSLQYLSLVGGLILEEWVERIPAGARAPFARALQRTAQAIRPTPKPHGR